MPRRIIIDRARLDAMLALPGGEAEIIQRFPLDRIALCLSQTHRAEVRHQAIFNPLTIHFILFSRVASKGEALLEAGEMAW